MSWTIDPAHTSITFSARHMMVMNVRGQFEKISGSVDFNETNPELTKIDVQIETASINTNEPKRDAHLKSPDFFNVEQFPYMTFKSTKVELVDATHARLTGDLTIRDVTRPVTLEVEYMGQAKSPWGTTSAGFAAQTKINRTDWGLNWNVALETGGWLVSEAITINVDVEIVKQPEAETAAAA